MATITSVAGTVTATGFSAPSFADILAFRLANLQTIFGQDIYIAEDSQEGQLAAARSQADTDLNAMGAAVYASYSPATAVGIGLSSVVKTNGITRAVPSNSTVDVSIIGVAGTIISNGIVQDSAGNKWDLPALVIIPAAGTITVTATAEASGAVSAIPGAVNQISTPTLGWQTVANPSAAALGAPVETDKALRVRQSESTMLPSRTVLDGIMGGITSLAGVERTRPYVNSTDQTDVNGIPSHSMAIVAEGGDAVAIANAIIAKKDQGTGTFGTTIENVLDPYGMPQPIKFFRPTYHVVNAALSITALAGFTTAIENEIISMLTNWLNTLQIGQKVMVTRAIGVVSLLGGSADASTFELNSITLNGVSADVVIAFNEAAQAGTVIPTVLPS